MDSENSSIHNDNDTHNENDMPTVELDLGVNVLSKKLVVGETSMRGVDASTCTQDISSEKYHVDVTSKDHHDGTDIRSKEKSDSKLNEKLGNEIISNSDRVDPEEKSCTENVTNNDRDDSPLLGVVLSTPEQHASEDNHAIKLNEVSSSFNLDSNEPLDVGNHASMPVFSTSQISLASTDTRTDHQIFLDHYYDSDETVLTNTTHSETPGEEDRKYDWDKKSFSSHVEFMMYMEAWGSFLVLHPFLF